MGEIGLFAKDEPPDAGIHQSELVARDVDRSHLLEAEVPLVVGVEEWPDEAAARAVDVERHVQSALVPDLDQELVDPDDVVGVACEGRSQDGGHADRVLVDVRLHVLGADRVLVGLERDDPRLDIEVAAELLPDDVDVAAEDEVWLVCRSSSGFTALSPLPLEREGAEHDGLRRSLGPRSGRLAWRVEEVGEHPDAALLDLRRLRVLGVVDEVPVEVRRR